MPKPDGTQCEKKHERVLNWGEQARHAAPTQQAAKLNGMDQELPLSALSDGQFNTL